MTEVSMRDAFTELATTWLDEERRAALVLADMGVDGFAEAQTRHPERVINVGIREQSLIGVTAGLAMEGFRPVAHSYAPFLVERPFEQIKLDLGFQGVGAVLVSVGASYDWAPGGRTHHAPEDVALVSTLPDWQVFVPGHAGELTTLFRHAADSSGSCYIRLSSTSNREPMEVAPGRFTVLRRVSQPRATVIAVGPMLDPVLDAVSELEVDTVYATTVRPLDTEGLVSGVRSDAVVIVEPYQAGTSTAEVMEVRAHRPTRVLALGVPRTEHRKYGDANQHTQAFGLDAAGLRTSIRRFLS